MLVREGKVVYRSPVLQHFFDCPLQFGAVPDFSESTDSAEDAAVAELQVQPGDVLLAGSDGLWDNCYDAELLQLLPEQPHGAQQVLARQCAPLMGSPVRCCNQTAGRFVLMLDAGLVEPSNNLQHQRTPSQHSPSRDYRRPCSCVRAGCVFSLPLLCAGSRSNRRACQAACQ